MQPEPVTHSAEMAHPGQGFGLPAFVRVAVLCRLPQQGPRWASAAADAFAERLAEDGLTHFDYFPVDFTRAQTDDQIAQAFALIGASRSVRSPLTATHEHPFDAIVIAGGADLDSDIALIHRVLAPNMRDAGLPVLCTLGADDASTILGDSAWRVFADPLQLLEMIAGVVRPAGPSAEVLCEQIRSLAGFFLTELEIESRILRDSAIVPAVRKHLVRQEAQSNAASQATQRAAEQLQLRLLREAGKLERTRARIGAQLAQAQRQAKRRDRLGLDTLRASVLAIFIAIVSAFWLLTSPATTIFVSGCTLVVLSAAYVAISNRIAERDT